MTTAKQDIEAILRQVGDLSTDLSIEQGVIRALQVLATRLDRLEKGLQLSGVYEKPRNMDAAS